MHLPLKQNKPSDLRFDRFNLVLAILLAGWVPPLLMLWFSYTILRDTLESKILRDRQTFVQLIGHLVGDDLSRTGGIIEYYQTLPDTAKLLTTPNAQPAAQQWLATAFYSQPRIDSMFMTGADGRLIASVPAEPDMVGKDYQSQFWREAATSANGAYVSPVHSRSSDKRMATDIVGAVRMPNGTVAGYLGVSVLIERIGRRLSTIEFSDQSYCQVLDQNGAALFTKDLKANPNAPSPEGQSLIQQIGHNKRGHIERQGYIYSFNPIEGTGWMAVVEQARSIAVCTPPPIDM